MWGEGRRHLAKHMDILTDTQTQTADGSKSGSSMSGFAVRTYSKSGSSMSGFAVRPNSKSGASCTTGPTLHNRANTAQYSGLEPLTVATWTENGGLWPCNPDSASGAD